MSEALLPPVARPETTRPGGAVVLPAVIVDAGPAAVERFLEFFAARIANARTRAAYGRAVGQFLAWCEARAPAPRGDRHGHARRPARPGARLGDALQLRAGERGHRHAAAGLLPAGAPGVAPAPREGRHAARRPGPTIGRPRRSTTTSRGPGSTRRRRRSSRASTPRGGG